MEGETLASFGTQSVDAGLTGWVIFDESWSYYYVRVIGQRSQKDKGVSIR